MAEAVYQEGIDTVSFTLAADASPGDIVQVEDGRAGVVLGLNDETMKSGDVVKCAVSGRFRIACATATTFAVNVLIDWDDTTKLAVADASGDFRVGIAPYAKGAGPLFVVVDLNRNVVHAE